MSYRELDLTGHVKDAIRTVITRAEAAPISQAEMQDLAAAFDAGEPLPERAELSLSIPHGWHVTYMIETHKVGRFRRLRINTGLENLPPTAALMLLIEAFGFTTKIESCILYPEAGNYFNVMEPIDETMESFQVRMSRFAV